MGGAGSKVAPKKGGRQPRLDPAAVALALAQLMGNVSAVARRFGASRKAVQGLVARRPELQQVLRDAREAMVDHAESALLGAVARGEAWAVCFCLKTLGRSRGYAERQEAAVVHQVNWAEMTRAHRRDVPDPLEEKIRAIEALPDPDPGGERP